MTMTETEILEDRVKGAESDVDDLEDLVNEIEDYIKRKTEESYKKTGTVFDRETAAYIDTLLFVKARRRYYEA